MKFFVVTHREFKMDKNLKNRQIIVVGNHPDVYPKEIHDNQLEDNISDKNKYYSELTAYYYIWKNKGIDKDEIVGLEHYRRYFESSKINLFKNNFMSSKEAEKKLTNCDIIVPIMHNTIKLGRPNVFDDYKNGINHVYSDIDVTCDLIKEHYPQLADSLNRVIMNGHYSCLFNMFICKKQVFDEYCEWLFDLFSKLEEKLEYKDREGNKARVFGYLSERLLTLWIDYKHLKVHEQAVIFTSFNRWTRFKKRIQSLFRIYK